MERYPGYTEHEVSLMVTAEKYGCRVLAPETASGLFRLFLQGYSCGEIARNSKKWKEVEVLWARKMYNWDLQRVEYADSLNKRVRDQLFKSKAESVEFLTSMLNMTHDEYRDKLMRYVVSGNQEDRPDTWADSPSGYKRIIEVLQMVTGEDKKSKVDINQTTQTTIGINADDRDLLKKILTPEAAAKTLRHILTNKEDK
jgi:hypothetical protein